MLIKERHPNEAISMLEDRIKKEWRNRKALEREIRNIRAGDKSESSAAYFIDFEYKKSENWAILHDFRIEHNERVAQIDHLLINRHLDFYVLESKSFTTPLRITDHGEFERFISDTNTWEAIESPILQNRRHIAVLAELLQDSGLLPRRMGFQVKPKLHQIVLVNGKGTITRPPAQAFDTSRVVKGDDFRRVIEKEIGSLGTLGTLKAAMQALSPEDLRKLAEGLAAYHTPSFYSGAAPADLSPHPPSSMSVPLHPLEMQECLEPYLVTVEDDPTKKIDVVTAISGASTTVVPPCKACGKTNLEIAWGKFGYFWKCKYTCGANNKLVLPGPGKLRKDGPRFFHVTPENIETLFFENGDTIR